MEPTPGGDRFSSLDELQRQLNEDFAQSIGPMTPPQHTATAAGASSTSGGTIATTISTVVLQGGPLQLVVAILKSGEKLYIKVADLQPKFTFLGPSLDDALKLQNEHDELLRQIQNLPTPLEEFYRKIQEKIASNERPNPTLIEEMAASLNAVWHDIKKMLAERREIVTLNVCFFERLGEAYGKMSSLEVACNDTMIPIEIDAVREFLESFRSLRGDMLNAISTTLTAGNQMLDRLRVLAEIGTLDSRPNHIKVDAIQAIGQVEAWLEDLSNRRNQLEQAWLSRKTQLEQCLTLAILAKELEDIEQSLNRVRSQNLSSFTLGESAEQARDLLETYQNLKPEAALLRDKSLKITKATEELLTTGCFAGDEACAKAYSVLNACSEHLEEIDHRETLLSQSREFFGQAATILKRLDQLELEVTSAQMRPSSSNDLPAHQKLLQDIRESIGEVLQMGYSLVDDVGRTKPEVAGVQAMIEQIEQRKLSFERYCNEESERNVRTSQALNEFCERYEQLFAWLHEAREERVVHGNAIHRMGENLGEAKECLLLHHQLLNDLEIKGNAINNLLVRLTPSLEHLAEEQRDDVQRKIDLIRQKWIELKNYVIERVDLLKLYIKFHQEAETLRNQFDSYAIQFTTFKDNQADHSLILAATANIRQTLQSLHIIGDQCLGQLQKSSDPYLQKTRAAQCVQRTLAEFDERQLAISNEWESWNNRRRTETTLKKIMAANMETLAVTTKLAEQLYPIFSTALDNPTDLLEFVGRKRIQMQSDIRSAEMDLSQRFDTIDQLEAASAGASDATASLVEDIVSVKNNLNSIKTRLHSMGEDFTELANLVEQFLRSIVHCRDGIKEYFATKQTVTDPGSVEAIAEGYEQFKQSTMEHFRSLLQQSEQIIERIKAQEPPGAKEMDTDKIITLLENLRTYFESQTESENCELKKQHNVIAFDHELNDLRATIRAAGEQQEQQRGQYGENLPTAQTAKVAFEEYATRLQELQERIDAFVNSGTELVRQYPETSPYIESETHKIRNEWTELLRKIEEHRTLYNIATEYFILINSVEDNYRTLNAELINANNKLTILNNVDVANDLVTQVDNTIRTHETKQLDTLKRISSLSSQLYGFDKTVTIYTENTKLFQTFYKIKTEVYDRAKELFEQQQQREKLELQEQLQRDREQQRMEQQRLEQERLEQQQRQEQLQLMQQREEQQQREREQQQLEQQRQDQERLEKQRLEQQRQDQERQEIQRLEQQRQDQERLEQQRIEQHRQDQERIEQQRLEQLQFEQDHKERSTPVVGDVRITTTSMSSLPHQQQSFDVQTIDETQYLQEPQAPLVIQTVEEQVHEQIHEVITTTTTRQGHREPIKEQTEPEASLRFVHPLSDVCVQEGQRARLQCVVAGFPDPSIDWYKNGMTVQNNPDYKTSFDPASGVCTLLIDETVTADSASILCRATNEAGVADTTSQLLVTEAPPPPKPEGTPPVFAMKLLDGGMAQEGQMFQYDCIVTGMPSPTIHWYKGERCVDGSPDYRQSYDPTSGVASLRIEQVYLEDQTHYTCRAVNDCGSDETTAFLTVKPLEPTEFPDFPEPLSNVMARVGQKIRLEAKVTGTPQPELMWTHDGKHFTNREVKFFYENGRAQLVIDEAFLKDAGVYSLIAKNIAGEQCCSCNVVVKGRLPNETSDSELASDMEPVKPSVQLPLRDVSVFEGKPVRLDCVIVGQPEPEVIWYHGERPVKESTDFQLLFQGDRCSLVIREAFLEDAGEYRVVAINSAGEASSKCAVMVTPLNIAEPAVRQPVERVLPAAGIAPRFERLLSDILADEGERVQFECAVSGDPRPNIRWYVNNREIATDPAVSPRVHCLVREDGVVKLIIERVLPDDKGVYTVKAVSPSGEAKCFSNLIVKTINVPEFEAVPAFLTESQVCPTFRELFADRVVRQHESTKFECIVVGKPQPKIRWFFHDQPVQGHDFLVSTSGDRQVLTIPEVRPELTGKITCYAENEAGNAQCVAIVQILEQLGGAANPLQPAQPTITGESMQQVDTTGSSCVTLQKHVTTTSSSSFSSSSSATVQQNGVSHSEVHSESAKLDRSFKQVNDQAPEVAEAKQFQRYDQVNDQPPSVQQESSFLAIAQNNSAEMHETIIANSGQISTGKPARRNMAPRFVTPFNGKIVDQGADVLIEGIVDGYPSPDVKITKNDVELQPDGERIKVAYSLNKIVVELHNVSPLDAGRYTATASNTAGASTSTAELVVKKSIFPPVFGRRLQAQTVRGGDRVVLDVEATGTPDPSVAWFKDNRPVQESLALGSYSLQQVGSCFKLIFEQISPSDTGKYMVLAKNAGGEAQSIADIAVLECESQAAAPQPQPQPAPQKHVSFVDMVQQQQPKSAEPFDSSGGSVEGGGFSARQEYSSEAKLHGPTTESTIVTETRRTTEATMRMEHKINFPDLPVRFSQRTQTPTVPTVTEGTSPGTIDPTSDTATTGTNTEHVATRSDATQTAAVVTPLTPTPTLARPLAKQCSAGPVPQPPTVASAHVVDQSDSRQESSSSISSIVRDRPKSFRPLQPTDFDLTAQLVGEERTLIPPPPPTPQGASQDQRRSRSSPPGQGMRSYPPVWEVPVAGGPGATSTPNTLRTSYQQFSTSTTTCKRADLLKPLPETIPTPPIFRSELGDPSSLPSYGTAGAPIFPHAEPLSPAAIPSIVTQQDAVPNLVHTVPSKRPSAVRARSSSPRPSADAIAMERLWTAPKAFGGAAWVQEEPSNVYRQYRPPPPPLQPPMTATSSSSSSFTKHTEQQHNYSTLPFARNKKKLPSHDNTAKARSDSLKFDFQPIYQPAQPQQQQPPQMYSSFSSTQQFQASSTLSQQQYSQSAMQYQPYKPSPVEATVPSFVPSQVAPPPAQSFPPQVFKPTPVAVPAPTMFTPTSAPAPVPTMFTPTPAPAPAPAMFTPSVAPAAAPLLPQVANVAALPQTSLAAGAGPTPAFLSGPSYNQTPQPFKPLPPPSITPSSLNTAPAVAPIEPLYAPQSVAPQAFAPAQAPAPAPIGPVSLPAYQEPLSFSAHPSVEPLYPGQLGQQQPPAQQQPPMQYQQQVQLQQQQQQQMQQQLQQQQQMQQQHMQQQMYQQQQMYPQQVPQQEQQQYYMEQQEEVYKKMSVKETKKLFEETLMQQQQQMQHQQVSFGELKAPRMVQGMRQPGASLPADFGYGAIAELGLEPGPQPTMGYAPKQASSERKSSSYREQIEQSLLESMDKEPERVPAGGVKIIPPSPRKKSKPPTVAGQSDTGSIAGGAPAPFEQPHEEPQQGLGPKTAPPPTDAAKSPFTATESEYESDLDGGIRKQNGYLADTEEVVQKSVSFSSEVQQQQVQQQTIESFSSTTNSSKVETHSTVVSSTSTGEVIQQQVQQELPQVQQELPQVQQELPQVQQEQPQVQQEQPQMQQQQPQMQQEQQQEQQPQQVQQVAQEVVTPSIATETLQQTSEEVIVSSSETIQKELVEESSVKNFLVNNDLPEDMQPVKVLPTEEPLPTLKHVPVPAAVQPVPEPEAPAPVIEQQQQQQPPVAQPEPIVPVVEQSTAAPVQQNGYPTPSPAAFVSDYESDAAAAAAAPTAGTWRPGSETAPGVEGIAGYKPVHPVFAPPKQDGAAGPGVPPPSVFDPIDKIQPNQTKPIDAPKIEKPKPISYVQQQQQHEQAYQQQQQSMSYQQQSYQQQTYQQQQQQSFPPAAQSTPAQYYTSVTAQPVHNTIATETSNTLHMKEMTESSNRVLNMQQTQRVISLEQQQHQQQQQQQQQQHSQSSSFMQKAGRFNQGDSDGYDSDGTRIRPLWTPNPSDSDEPHYRSVRPNFQQHPRSTSLPRQYERIQTPMEFDTLPVQMPTRIDVSASGLESSHQRSSSLSRQTVETMTTTTTSTETLKTQTLDRYGSKRLATTPLPNMRDDMAVKAHRVAPINYIQKQAQSQGDGMAQAFKSKAYHFSNEVMTDIKKTPIKPILKNAYAAPYAAPVPAPQYGAAAPQQMVAPPQQTAAPAQAYREESRVSQYGTKHVDPDTGIIYFKYDFGYEFGIIFPGEGHRIVAGRSGSNRSGGSSGSGKKHPRYLNPAQFARGDITVPVQHERTKDFYRNCRVDTPPAMGNPPYGVRSASVPATDMHASARYGHAPFAGTSNPASYGGSGRSTPSRGDANRNSFCVTPDPTAQGFNRSTTSTPNVKHQEEGVPTKTPLFVAPLKDIAVVSGQPARFECIVACDATPSIRWTKDEAPIEDGFKYVPEHRNGVCRLSLPVAYEGDAGRYCCLAENHLGYAATCAELTVANSDWRANQ